MRVAEVQFVVDVAFNSRHVVPLEQFDQLALFLVGHLEPEGILEIRHHHARGDPAGVEKPGKHTNIYSFTRMRRDFDRAHSHPLDRMQHRVERRRLDGHRITGFPDRLQAEILIASVAPSVTTISLGSTDTPFSRYRRAICRINCGFPGGSSSVTPHCVLRRVMLYA